ncbi:MAG: HNH endonuclease [Acidimicrobiia bacterium]|nr:HNH endonuclease [Acidimicrobiia bacterium]
MHRTITSWAFRSRHSLSLSCVDHEIDGSSLIPKRSAKHRFRQQIFTAWQHVCAYCASPADTLDHVKPRHKGGATVTNNLVPACRDCNRKKGSEEWLSWYAKQSSTNIHSIPA